MDDERKNFIKCGVCLNYVRDGIARIVESEIQQFHKDALMTVFGPCSGAVSVCGCCSSRDIKIDSKQKKWTVICPTETCCKLLSFILNCHAFPQTKGINWCNGDLQKWTSDFWQLGKFFMNAGQTAANTGPDLSDCSALLHLVTHCKRFATKISVAHAEKVKSYRNDMAHSSSIRLPKKEFDTALTDMVSLLNSVQNANSRPEVAKAIQDIKKMKDSTVDITEPDMKRFRFEAKEIDINNSFLFDLSKFGTNKCDENRPCEETEQYTVQEKSHVDNDGNQERHFLIENRDVSLTPVCEEEIPLSDAEDRVHTIRKHFRFLKEELELSRVKPFIEQTFDTETMNLIVADRSRKRRVDLFLQDVLLKTEADPSYFTDFMNFLKSSDLRDIAEELETEPDEDIPSISCLDETQWPNIRSKLSRELKAVGEILDIFMEKGAVTLQDYRTIFDQSNSTLGVNMFLDIVQSNLSRMFPILCRALHEIRREDLLDIARGNTDDVRVLFKEGKIFQVDGPVGSKTSFTFKLAKGRQSLTDLEVVVKQSMNCGQGRIWTSDATLAIGTLSVDTSTGSVVLHMRCLTPKSVAKVKEFAAGPKLAKFLQNLLAADDVFPHLPAGEMTITVEIKVDKPDMTEQLHTAGTEDGKTPRGVLRRNRKYLLEEFDPHVIMNELHATALLNNEDVQSINARKRRRARTDKFIDVLLEKDERVIEAFIDILRQNEHYKDIYDELTKDKHVEEICAVDWIIDNYSELKHRIVPEDLKMPFIQKGILSADYFQKLTALFDRSRTDASIDFLHSVLEQGSETADILVQALKETWVYYSIEEHFNATEEMETIEALRLESIDTSMSEFEASQSSSQLMFVGTFVVNVGKTSKAESENSLQSTQMDDALAKTSTSETNLQVISMMDTQEGQLSDKPGSSKEKSVDTAAIGFMKNDMKDVKDFVTKHGVGGLEMRLQNKLEEWRAIPLNIAIAGNAGTGKSSFINAMRGLTADDEGGAAVDVVEATSIPTPYRHPLNDNLQFWDLPGVGTQQFPEHTYMKNIKFENYDFFLVFLGNRCTENDLWLAKEVQKKGKQLLFIRTKIDADIDSNKRAHPNTHNEQDVILKIRQLIQKTLHKADMKNIDLFIISNFDITKWDFPDLDNYLIAKLPIWKREAMSLSIGNLTKEILQHKKQLLGKRIKYVALASAMAGPIPVPGLSIAVDMGLILSEANFYRSQFGLDDRCVEAMAKSAGTTKEILQKKAGIPKIGSFTAQEIAKLLTKQAASAAAKGAISLALPVLGCIEAGSVSFGITYTTLNSLLNNMESDALKILEVVTKLSTSD